MARCSRVWGMTPSSAAMTSKRGVQPADTCQHVLDEVAVTGYIYDADLLAAGQGQPGKAEVNGHKAFLFFFETVGIDAGEGSDEGGFAVVNVAGSADNAHGSSYYPRGTSIRWVPRCDYFVLMIRS